MKIIKLVLNTIFICCIYGIGYTQICTDTVKYVSYKSSKIINVGKKDSVCYMGKLFFGDGVSQSFINNDVVKLNGVSIRMAAYKFEKAKYTLSTESMSVKVYLQEVDQQTFKPNKKIDSTEILIKEDKFYVVNFSKMPTISSNFAITIQNNTKAPSLNLKYALRVYANNASTLKGGYGEEMGFVTAANLTLSNRQYFESLIPSSMNGAGFLTGGNPNEQLIDWDYYVYPIISYSISPQITSTNLTPDNNSNVEVTRMNKLSIGSNHMLSYSGFTKKYFGTIDSTFVWNIKGKKSIDSVYKFTYYNGDNLGTFTVNVKGFTSNCKSTVNIKDIGTCNLTSQITGVKKESGLGKNDGSATVLVSGGNSPYTYQWTSSPIQTSNILSNVGSGFYYVTILDAKNCQIKDSVFIPIECQLSLRLKELKNESGSSKKDGYIITEATGGTIPISYSWNNGKQTPSIYDLSKGNYSITATDKNGCKVNGSFEVALCDLKTSDTTIVDESYVGKNDGSITVSISGGNSPYSYDWSTVPKQYNSKATSLSKGTYTLVVKDSKACELKVNFAVNLKCNLTSRTQLISPDSAINKKDGVAVVQIFGGKLPYTYSWGGVNDKDTIKNISEGKYIVLISDANSCVHKDSVIMFTNKTSCKLKAGKIYTNPESFSGKNDAKAYVDVTGGTLPYQYEWNTIPKQFSDTAQNLTAGTYQVIIEDANKCKLVKNVEVNLSCDLSIKLVGKDETTLNKKDGYAIVKINGGKAPYSIVWNNTPALNNDTLLNIGKGIYTVNIKDSKNCKLIDSISINTLCDLKINFDVSLITQPGKEDGSVKLKVFNAAIPYKVKWNNNNSTEINTGLKKGSYTVTVIDANNCILTDSIFVGVANLESIASLSFNVFPNPFNNVLNLNFFNQKMNDNVNIKLLDLSGKLIHTEFFNITDSNFDTQLNLIDLLPGIYLLEINNGYKSVTRKIIKE